LCVTLVIYQESLRDARSTEYKILLHWFTCIYFLTIGIALLHCFYEYLEGQLDN